MLDYIRQSNLIEDIDNPQEDEQSMYAWEYLIEQDALHHMVIRKVQKIITFHQKGLMPHQRGYYRDMSNTHVFVGGKMAPSAQLVPALMDNWLLDFPDREPLVNHIAFEKIHPFVDGNGRTGRMLLWWQEIKTGGEPTMFLASEKHQKYYPLFS